jgi:hypothetical protein
MSISKALIASALLLGSGAIHAQNASYTFQSEPFENVIGTYTTSQSVSGTLVLSEFVPPNTTMDVTPILVSYSFTDGVLTLDDTNSASTGFFGIQLTTDAVGRIEAYAMTFWESPNATNVGDVFGGMDIGFNRGAGAPGCTPGPDCGRATLQINSGDIECTSVVGGQCDGGVPLPDGGNGGLILAAAAETGLDPGFDTSTWMGQAPPRAIPTLNHAAVLLLTLMLAVLGIMGLRSRSA